MGDRADRVRKSTIHNSWKSITTLRESFFYMRTDYAQTCLPTNEALETRERDMVSPNKLMVTIARHLNGFHVIEPVLKKQKLIADYSCSFVLTKLSKIVRTFRTEMRRK
jgi:hypothetical protein